MKIASASLETFFVNDLLSSKPKTNLYSIYFQVYSTKQDTKFKEWSHKYRTNMRTPEAYLLDYECFVWYLCLICNVRTVVLCVMISSKWHNIKTLMMELLTAPKNDVLIIWQRHHAMNIHLSNIQLFNNYVSLIPQTFKSNLFISYVVIFS